MERGKKNEITALTQVFCSEYSRLRRTYAGGPLQDRQAVSPSESRQSETFVELSTRL